VSRRTFRIRARRLLVVATVLLAVAIALGGVAVSPLVTRELSGSNAFWTRQSLIGQTYGAVSAVLAASRCSAWRPPS
jgi:hypothetical protein